MKDQRVAGFLMVLVSVLSLIGVSGLVGAQAQTAAVSSNNGPVVKSPPPVHAPPPPNFAPGDAVLTGTGSALRPRASDINFTVTGSGSGIYCTGTGSSYVVPKYCNRS